MADRMDAPPAPLGRAPPRPTAVVRFGSAHAVSPALAAAWDDLAADAAEPNSFAERWFACAGLRQFGRGEDGGEVRLLQLWEGSRLLGLLPLAVHPCYGRIPMRHVGNWKHANDFLGVPLIRRGRETDFWTHALRALDAAAWAPGFLHINGLVEGGRAHAGLAAAAAALGRPCDVVHRSVRALLADAGSADAYYADTVRKKKRKELARLGRRLAELGALTSTSLSATDDLDAWIEAFLTLEHGGWKGRAGSSLASARGTEAFFRDAVVGAQAAGKLEFRRMDLDGRPVAMLINFIAAPGGFSFKTAFDEAYARYSPGVLIQLDNMSSTARPDVEWMDSCAAENHPMIDSLWGQRRAVVRVSVPLGGFGRAMRFRVARALEDGSARFKRMRRAAKERNHG